MQLLKDSAIHGTVQVGIYMFYADICIVYILFIILYPTITCY